MTRRALLPLVLAACSPGPTVVALALSADDTCRDDHYQRLASVSVEVYGDADGELCTLARRCVTVDAPADVVDLEAALRAATQPLVDIELAGARQIAVYGHERLGCGAGARDLCGFADLADAGDGALAIPVRCDDVDLERCPAEVPPFCP